jgi:hypothetical protein
MNEDKQITEIIASKAFRVFLGLLFLAIIVFALLYCNSKPQPINEPIVNTNPLNEIVQDKDAIIETAKQRIEQLKDSLAMVNKPKIIYRKIYVYDSLLIADTACINSLVTLYNQCAKVDSVNEYIISNQSNQIAEFITLTNNQQDIIDIRNYQHGVDSVNEVAYKEQIKVEIKNSKRKYRRGLLQGGAVGLGVGFIGGLMIK